MRKSRPTPRSPTPPAAPRRTRPAGGGGLVAIGDARPPPEIQMRQADSAASMRRRAAARRSTAAAAAQGPAAWRADVQRCRSPRSAGIGRGALHRARSAIAVSNAELFSRRPVRCRGCVCGVDVGIDTERHRARRPQLPRHRSHAFQLGCGIEVDAIECSFQRQPDFIFGLPTPETGFLRGSPPGRQHARQLAARTMSKARTPGRQQASTRDSNLPDDSTASPRAAPALARIPRTAPRSQHANRRSMACRSAARCLRAAPPRRTACRCGKRTPHRA